MTFISNEILLLVADNITHQEDYFRLLRVCRRWHELLFLRAYRRISVSEDQIYPLVCCIYSNPEIGAAIQELNLWWVLKGLKIEYDVEMVKDAVQRACDSPAECKKWIDRLRQGNSDAWLAVLVQSLEAVTVLGLDFSIRSSYFIPMLGRAATRDPPFDTKPVLQRLKCITLKTEDNKTAFDASNFLPLFQLPEMRVFSAHALTDAYESFAVYPNPGTSGIRELRLGGTITRCNGSKGFANYITACANLEILEYQHDNVAIWSQYSGSFQSGAFYTALLTQKHSLRELKLNDNGENTTENCDNDSDDEDDCFNRFGSLAEFHQLTELRIPVRTILQFGHGDRPTVFLLDVLPPNLVYLHLADYHEEDSDVIVANLKDVVTQRTKKFSNLTKIRLQSSELEHIPQTPRGWRLEVPTHYKQTFAPLQEICREVGIEFCLCKPGWAAVDD
ncbi:hypothetical protein N7507_001390 [Penicillium longicatenatum]|nr:hypothetical protein N7507_001390 [Penicillium longicatenatum]